MRKKYRLITVDGAEYAWAVNETMWPNFVLRVWKEKNNLWFEKEYDLDSHPITPKVVAEEIRARLREVE